MRKLLLVGVVLSGCTPSSPSAKLADLPSPQIYGQADGMSILYDNTATDCFELSSDVHATVDGQPMTITRGGWQNYGPMSGNECNTPAFSFPTSITKSETTALVLSDGETTWSLGVTGLAPQAWTVTAPSQVTEGSDVTVTLSPTIPGVLISELYIAPTAEVSPFSGVPTASNPDTVTIDPGYWSNDDQVAHGSTLAAKLSLQLSPLPVTGCEALQSCTFIVQTPDPAVPVTVSIP